MRITPVSRAVYSIETAACQNKSGPWVIGKPQGEFSARRGGPRKGGPARDGPSISRPSISLSIGLRREPLVLVLVVVLVLVLES